MTADATLAQIGALFNWHASRDDDFHSPIKTGGRKEMRRAKPLKERERDRVLSDQELRVMWPILGDMGIYGASVKCMLLTTQRVHKVGAMRRSKIIDGVLDPKTNQIIDGVWDPTRKDDPPNKPVSLVPLSRMAREVIAGVPIVDADDPADWVFSLNGRKTLGGWSKFKKSLDKKMLAALRKQAEEAGDDPHKVTLEPWQHRDLRRTARTLMPRADVRDEIAERALGHVMGGVKGVYNRYEYLFEKREAFEALAALVERIVYPPKDAVVTPFRRRRTQSSSKRKP